jgi:hypothetical protein
MTRTQTSLRAKWDAYLYTPFPVLVRLSATRIFHGSNAGEEELNISMGLLLTLLAIPGGFASVFLFDKYGSFLQWLRGEGKFDPLAAAMPDEYFFIVLSMVVTGGVALWWWDSIFPDHRDFINLVPLPIPTSRIFRANALAIFLLTGLCAIDVNAASSILFPATVGGSQPSFKFLIQFGAVHVLVVVLGSIFSFLAVFATVGVLMLALPYRVFRRISLYVRTLIATLLLATLFTSFVVPSMIVDSPGTSHSPLRFLPSAWFLGLCQLLRGRAHPALTQLAHLAIVALPSVCLVVLITYTLGYRRCFMRLAEFSDTPAGNLGMQASWIFNVLDRVIFRTPFQQAGYRFSLRTLFRNETHALAIGGSAGLALVLASRTLYSVLHGRDAGPFPSAEVLSIPLIFGYCLLVAIRFGFDVPAYLRANWVFRFLLPNNSEESVTLARRILLCLTLPWIVFVAFPIYGQFWGWTLSLLHCSLVMLWFVLLTEVLIVGFRKLPFTCTYPPFQHSAVVLVMGYVFGFFLFTVITSQLELYAFSRPCRGTLLLILSLAMWYAVYRIRRSVREADAKLIFVDVPAPAFECLHLSDGG